MQKIYNPSMQEEPSNHPTRIIPLRKEETIIGWLENAGRFMSQDIDEIHYDDIPDEFVDEIVDEEPYLEDEDED